MAAALWCVSYSGRPVFLADIDTAPFMIMGRVTYIHHYVGPTFSLTRTCLTPLIS